MGLVAEFSLQNVFQIAFCRSPMLPWLQWLMVEIGCWRISVRPAFLSNVIPKISRDGIDDVIGGSTNTKA